MKKCSTAAFLLAAALSSPAHAGRACNFLPDAPAVHRVQPGDTLWGIASVFLQNPWCWPQVWEGNREQVTNPHRIYPGQRIVLDRQAGRLRALPDGGAIRGSFPQPADVRLTPAARTMAMPESLAIPAIAPLLLQSATRFRLVDPANLDGAMYITGFADGRQLASSGDIAFARGELPAGSSVEIVRVLEPVRDPQSGAMLALPLLTVGAATYLRKHDSGPLSVRIGQTSGEVAAGDLLLPVRTEAAGVFVLSPARSCDGQVATLLREGGRGGPGDVVVLNRGRSTGLDGGSLVAVTKQVRIGADDSRHAPLSVTDPVATLLVFDALEQSALALVLQSRDTIGSGDAIGALPSPD